MARTLTCIVPLCRDEDGNNLLVWLELSIWKVSSIHCSWSAVKTQACVWRLVFMFDSSPGLHQHVVIMEYNGTSAVCAWGSMHRKREAKVSGQSLFFFQLLRKASLRPVSAFCFVYFTVTCISTSIRCHISDLIALLYTVCKQAH